MERRGVPTMKRIFQVASFVAIAAVVAAAPGDTRVRWNDDHSRTDLEIRGTVEFTDNDSDVKNISDDGYFRIEQWSGGPTRAYLVRPGSKGIERLYSIDGVSRPLDADGRAWLARVL